MANEPIIGEDKTIEYDPTEERKKRCEPVTKRILQELLDEGLLYSDMQYVERMVVTYLDLAFKKIIVDHNELIFDTLSASLKKALEDANDILWEKEGDKISLVDIDKVLKKDVK